MISYELKNLDCAGCANRIEEVLKKHPDVSSVSINYAASLLRIETGNIEKVKAVIKEFEPDVEIVAPGREKGKKANTRKNLIFLGVSISIFVSGLVFYETLHPVFYGIPEYVLFLSIYFASGWRILFKAFRNILKGNIFDENFLMAVATMGAIAIHAVPEAVGVMLFYRIGQFLEEAAVFRSRKTIKALLSIRPDYARRKTDEGYVRVNPEEVKIGDIILVKPGERVPLDGIIIKGSSIVDTSALTGESIPAVLKEKDSILSGMILVSGSLVVSVSKSFKESSISRILEMVENAISKKAKTEKFITSFARYYTPFVVVFALLIALIPPFLLGMGSPAEWLYRALVILVISCPCALVISIPLGYFGGIGTASKMGILIKGSSYIDILNSVDTVVFDKTGTLTKGIFKVTEVFSRNGFSRNEILRYSAIAESHSNHPVAVSIKKAYGKDIDPSLITKHKEKAGYGVEVEIENHSIVVGNDRFLHFLNIDHSDCDIERTVAYVVVDGKYAGYIIISDELKDGAAEAISGLKAAGIKKTIMLTGDNKHAAKHVADSLEIDEYHADLLPEDKVDILEEIIKSSKNKVAFVGDGMNDAPVIARADVGFSMGISGSDAAIETADVVLMTDSLSKISESIILSRKTRGIVLQNIILALGIKLAFVVFGASGLSGMWEAVFADVGVTLLAILNSLRILRKSNI